MVALPLLHPEPDRHRLEERFAAGNLFAQFEVAANEERQLVEPRWQHVVGGGREGVPAVRVGRAGGDKDSPAILKTVQLNADARGGNSTGGIEDMGYSALACAKPSASPCGRKAVSPGVGCNPPVGVTACAACPGPASGNFTGFLPALKTRFVYDHDLH